MNARRNVDVSPCLFVKVVRHIFDLPRFSGMDQTTGNLKVILAHESPCFIYILIPLHVHVSYVFVIY